MFVKYLLNTKASVGMHLRNEVEKRVKSIDKWFENFDHIIQEVFDNQDVHLTFDIDKYEFKIEQSGRNPISFDRLSSVYKTIFEIVTDIMMRMLSFEKLINKYLKDQILSYRLLIKLGKDSQFATFKRAHVRRINTSLKGKLNLLVKNGV